MSEVLRLHGLGATVEVRCTGDAAPALSAAMRQAWSRCLDSSSPDAADVATGEPVVVIGNDESRLTRELQTATQLVTRALIGARAGQLLMLHAGAVSNADTGASLVYVAPGGTGKTTLSRLLGRRFGYLTDETVGIDETGRIHPYPKPLSVRRPAEGALKDEVSPDALGLLPNPSLPRVGRMVLLDRCPELEGVELMEVPFMDALFELAQQCSFLSRLPRPLHYLADVMDRTGPVLRLRYSEAADAQEDLSALVGELT